MLRSVAAAFGASLALLLSGGVTASANGARCDDNGFCVGEHKSNPSTTIPRKSHPPKTKPAPKPPWWERPAPSGCLRTVLGYHCPDPAPSPPNPADSVRQVIARLKLPDPTPRFGPDPSANEWNMMAVGFPIWLWTDRPTSLSTTAHHDGLTFTLNATWESTTFTLGDGHSITCTDTTKYPTHVSHPGQPSPTCGYVYEDASPPGHPYTVTAEAHWRVDWAAAGQHGTLNTSYSADRLLEVGELQSLVRG